MPNLNLARVTFASTEHLVPIFLTLLFSIGLILFAKRKCSEISQKRIIHVLACFISATVVCFHLKQILSGTYNIVTDLPLYLCSFIALIIPFYTYKLKYWLFEILVFWVFAGTLQGIITPDIPEGFPSFDYFRYWTVHLGLVVVMCYSCIVFNMKLKLKSVFKSFLVLQVYALCVFLLNLVLKSNYSYLNNKPDMESALDYLGDWPYYLLSLELIILPLFFIVYLILKKR